MDALGFFKRGFGLRDCQFALLALFFLRGRFLLALSFAPLFFSLERTCCSGGSFIIEFARLWFFCRRLALVGVCLTVAMPKSRGNAAFSLKVSFEPTARLRTTPGLAIVAAMIAGSSIFLGEALMEKVALRTPGLQSRLHRRRRDCELEEAKRGLIGFQLPRH